MKIKVEKSENSLKAVETRVIPTENTKVHKPHRRKNERSKRIRYLVPNKREEKAAEIEAPHAENSPSNNKAILLLSVGILVVAAVLYQLNYGSCEFWAAYNKNFNRIVYGDEDYCHRLIDTATLSQKLRENMVQQDDAIQLIEGSLKLANREGFIQMIFRGPTGVGKSLSANILSGNFQWRNVQKFVWSQRQTSARLFHDAVSGLSKCGFNLIIIDDLAVSDKSMEFVRQFESELRKLAKSEEYRVVLINIFNGLIEREERKSDLSNFVIIDFRAFSHDDLVKCIELHRKLYNVKIISASEMEELTHINYTLSGCKQVSKRLNLVSNKYK